VLAGSGKTGVLELSILRLFRKHITREGVPGLFSAVANARARQFTEKQERCR
jgi:hypothetical protein